MNELNQLYSKVIKAWNGDIQSDGKIVMLVDGKTFPVILDDQEVHLPLPELLDKDTNGKVFFHPACESIVSKETEIFKIIRRMAAFSMLVNFKKFPPVLFDIANRKSKKSLRNSILETMELLKSAKTSVRKEVASIFEHMEVEINQETMVDRRFIHFEIKRGGRSKLTKDKIYYSCKPVFPFYNEIIKRLALTEGQADNKLIGLLGKEFSRSALVIAEEIFRFVIPGVDDPMAYEQEQLTADAARFNVFVNTFAVIISDFNNCQNTFRSDFDKAGVYEIDTSFLDLLEDVDKLHRQVPPMPYNSQTSVDSSESSNQNLATGFGNFTSSPSGTVYNEVNTSSLVPQNNNNTNNFGFVNEVRAGLAPGETWLSVTQDPSGKFVHTIQTPNGICMVNYSRGGNFLNREFPNPLQALAMTGMNPQALQQQQLLQHMWSMGGMGGMGGMMPTHAPSSITPTGSMGTSLTSW